MNFRFAGLKGKYNMNKLKYGIGLWTVGFTADRFIPSGYRPADSFEKQIERVAEIAGVEAVQIHYPDDFIGFTPKEVKNIIESYGLKLRTINMNLFGNPVFRYGAFSNADRNIRRQAIDLCKEGIEIVRELGCPHLEMWPGQDGFDYNFQGDYNYMWDSIVSALQEICETAPELKFSYEYKLKEPRSYLLVSNAGRALNLANEVGADNFGITLDYGHSLFTRENPAEALMYLNRAGKLFNIHFNDNYGEFDDDLIAGTVSVWKTLEFVWHLKKIDYEGYVNLDMFPFRENQVEAASLAIRMAKSLEKLAENLDEQAIKKYQSENNITEVFEILRKQTFSA